MPEKIAEKVLSWVPEAQLEPDVVEQVKRISRLPFVQPYVAVMPDCHLGMGAAVGSCIPTERALIPAAIGVDIGCGMIAVKTSLVRDDMPDDLVEIREAIEHQIPSSAGKYNRSIKRTAVSKVVELENLAGDRLDDYAKIAPKWRLQLGSLGSGNHFIELVTDEHESVWLFLHSGSRGIGNKLAMFHIRVARDLMTEFHIQLEDLDLAYLTEGTPQFDAYHQDLMWAQHFALLNRQEMMDPAHRGVGSPGSADAGRRYDSVPSQLHPERAALWARPVGQPEGGHHGEGGADGPDTRVDGNGVVRREGQGLCSGDVHVSTWSGTPVQPEACPRAFQHG